MGGYGSGRPGWKQKAEDCRSIDVNRMSKAGCLKPGHWGGWQWMRDGEVVAKIGLRAETGKLVLDFKVRYGGNDWQDTKQPVPIVWTECRFGGERPYFLCPGVVNGQKCGRRVVKLFAGGRYFLCRQCYRLAYRCQSEERADRMLRRANKRRMALGGEPGTASWITKPKGMWQRTYMQKLIEIRVAEDQANRAFMSRFSKHLSPEELEMYF